MQDTSNASQARILVIDDDPQVLRFLAMLLERGGYAVTTESSGYKALEIIANEKTNLVILDLSMPEPDGFEVLTFLRENAPGLRILVISGFMGGGLLQAAELLGATSILNKADAPQKLLATVQKLLQY